MAIHDLTLLFGPLSLEIQTVLTDIIKRLVSVFWLKHEICLHTLLFSNEYPSNGM